MRNIAAGLFISLDGVVEAPDQWGFQFMTPEMSKGISAGIAQADAVLLGRRTYLEFAKLWPRQGSDVPMADFLNLSHKFVVSSTLNQLDWQPAGRGFDHRRHCRHLCCPQTTRPGNVVN